MGLNSIKLFLRRRRGEYYNEKKDGGFSHHTHNMSRVVGSVVGDNIIFDTTRYILLQNYGKKGERCYNIVGVSTMVSTSLSLMVSPLLITPS